MHASFLESNQKGRIVRIPIPLLFFPDETEHTHVGMPAPLHLPAAPARKASYVERYPPCLDTPVVVELVPCVEDETVVVDTPLARTIGLLSDLRRGVAK
jgi:hypothetical protein